MVPCRDVLRDVPLQAGLAWLHWLKMARLAGGGVLLPGKAPLAFAAQISDETLSWFCVDLAAADPGALEGGRWCSGAQCTHTLLHGARVDVLFGHASLEHR